MRHATAAFLCLLFVGGAVGGFSLAASRSASTGTHCVGARGRLFDDEFDPRSSLRNWNTVVGRWRAAGQLETYTRSALAIQHGALVVTAARAGSGFTSGRIDTASECQFTYGRVEARIETPSGQGLWPAFWLVDSHDINEIDVMEAIGQNSHWVFGSVHAPAGSSAKRAISARGYADHYHVYGIVWTPKTITFTVDYRVYAVVPNTINSPLYLVVNLAVGGVWPGGPNAHTPFPVRMYVDWVRVYS
jgi:beta-glucanase (GH16 family)